MWTESTVTDAGRGRIKEALSGISEVTDVTFREGISKEYIEVFLEKDISDDLISDAVKNCGEYRVKKVD